MSITKPVPKPSTPRAVSVARGGVVHALRYSGASHAYCGWRRFNFNMMISMEYFKSEYSDYEYFPPTDVYVTCLLCLTHEGDVP